MKVLLLMLMPLHWLCLCSHMFLVSGLCLDDQRSLLLQFKNNLTYSDLRGTRFNSWNSSEDCCRTWMGVTCDEEGHVTGLDLSDESISGGFNDSSSLFSLQHLQKLNMGYAALSVNTSLGSIPSKFKQLQKLTYLNLSHAGFDGQVPEEISQLTRLVTFDISFPYDFGINIKLEIPNLRKLVQNLTSIRHLYLDGVTISAQGDEWFDSLLSLPDLQELSMVHCNLSGPLLPSLAKLVSLSVIILDNNNFSSPVPETFASFKHLTTLSLSSCGLTGTFPHKIFQIATLSYIDISQNVDLHGSLPDFPPSGSLRTLRVSSTSFSGTIPHSIGYQRQLIGLDLSNCQFNGTLPSSLSNLTESGFMDLSNNKFTGPIPSLLFKLPSLTNITLSDNQFSQVDEFINVSSSKLSYLDISHNNLSGTFPMSFFQLSQLQGLRLHFNKLSGSVQLDKFSELNHLIELNLSYNNLTVIVNDSIANPSPLPITFYLSLASCNLKTFPTFLRNQARIFTLDLSNNQIEGEIPGWFWKQELTSLNLSHNLLSDLERPLQSISSSWLNILDLHHNQLKRGTILDFVCNSSILFLDLSFNKISSTIPSCLMMMTGSFDVLNLKNNNLSGPIPDIFPVSCTLWTLNLHGNLLGGLIPKSLANCSKLEVLDLGSNQFRDGFPCFMEKISTLRILVLRDNKFHGSLRCLEANKTWPMLQIIDIAFNNISGKLPQKSFKSWQTMKYDEDQGASKFINILTGNNYYPALYYKESVTVINKGSKMELVKILTIFTSIDFSSNRFEGPIPEELMDFKALHVLNLSNNALSGEIPQSVGNLKQLESLDLSHNSLSGEIPVQLASLSFLSYLNLSFNHLKGKIPTGTQLQSFDASSFEGNDDLYGPPLTEKPNGTEPSVLPEPACGRLACSIDWNFISMELGLVFGLGLVFVPLLFWKKWRIWYWKLVDNILCWIFPQLYLDYVSRRGQRYTVLRWWH